MIYREDYDCDDDDLSIYMQITRGGIAELFQSRLKGLISPTRSFLMPDVDDDLDDGVLDDDLGGDLDDDLDEDHGDNLDDDHDDDLLKQSI